MNKKMYGMLSLAILLSTAACSSADDLQLAKTEITVEYGDPLSLDPKDYLAEFLFSADNRLPREATHFSQNQNPHSC